ncbi:MAG: hypothetical protein WCF23_11090 [Candidatus Nitrosopolaris sp.]
MDKNHTGLISIQQIAKDPVLKNLVVPSSVLLTNNIKVITNALVKEFGMNDSISIQKQLHLSGRPAARLVRVAGLEQEENALLSTLHSKLATGLVPAVAVNVNRIELENVVLPFVIVAPLPSTAEVIVVSGGVGVVRTVL